MEPKFKIGDKVFLTPQPREDSPIYTVIEVQWGLTITQWVYRFDELSELLFRECYIHHTIPHLNEQKLKKALGLL